MGYSQKHGINIGSWLCWGDRTLEERAKWFTETDIHRLRDIGFDHLRLCLREIYFWDEDGKLDPRAIEILRQGIDRTLAAGMRASVNLHHLRAHEFNNLEEPAIYTDPNERDKFVRFWKELSGELLDYSTDQVAFEFLNEPVARDNQRWNDVWRPAYDVLRAQEKERTLILGPNLWNQLRTIHDLAVPENDPRMILDFHFYEPLLVTHYRSYVPWTNVPLKAHYPGKPLNMPSWAFGLNANLRKDINPIHRQDVWHENDLFNRDTIVARFLRGVEVADQHGLPLNLGEFGLWQNSNNEAGFRWLRDVLSVCEELGISWTVWSYGKGADGYGVINADGSETEKLKILREYMK
ncbi:MAG: cellulase family glycosylhydrolase [Anaerolineaceae bacterium]|nr:cellulase family glycosylhydrolase [Anaerolineaceae bacterium]